MVKMENAWNFISKDWGESLKFVLIIGVISLIPFIGQLILFGLTIKIINNVMKGKDGIPEPLDDLENTVKHGLKLLGFYLILSLPFFLIIGLFTGGAVTSLLTATASERVTMEILSSIMSLLPLFFLIGLLYLFIHPALLCNYASKQEFKAFFELSKALKILFNNFGAFLNMILIQILYSIALSLLAGLLLSTIIGSVLIIPLRTLISAKIMGDWYKEVKE